MRHGERTTVVKQGTFLYDGLILCDVRIERGAFKSGGGGFPSIVEAVASVAAAPGVGATVKWSGET